jgi:hypothetical protein
MNGGAMVFGSVPVVSVVAGASDRVRLYRPGPGGSLSGPVVTLPGNVRVSVDAGASGPAAAAWWRELAVVAMYAAMCEEPAAW